MTDNEILGLLSQKTTTPEEVAMITETIKASSLNATIGGIVIVSVICLTLYFSFKE